MGTRHLIKVICDGKLVMAQYGQNDGNPTGQGEDVCRFIRDTWMYDRLKTKAEEGQLKFLSDQDLEILAEIFNREGYPESIKETLSTIYSESHLSREQGAKVLTMAALCLYDFYTRDERDFEHDGILPCAYVHEIDVSRGTYTIYVPRTNKRMTYPVAQIQKWSEKKAYDEMKKLEDSWEDEEE